jgi:glutathione S-transferase
MPFFVKPVAKGIAGKVRANYLEPNVKRNLDFMNTTLGKATWFCGNDLTAADIQMSFAVEAAEVRTNLKANYPNLQRYLQQMRTLPTYQHALQMGGPYSLLGK